MFLEIALRIVELVTDMPLLRPNIRVAMEWQSIFLLFLAILFVSGNKSSLYGASSSIAQPRTLTFPATAPTRIQFIGGIGIPVEDLLYESITSGYVLKAEYFLPERAEEFRPNYLKPQIIHRRSLNGTVGHDALQSRNTRSSQRTAILSRSSHQHESSSSFGANRKSQQKHKNTSVYRWIIYRGMETILDNNGLAGRACILRSICEHAVMPFNHDSGMLGEIMHIILTPSVSLDDFSKLTDKEYLKAEIFGYEGGNCELEYKRCPKSPIDLISAILDLEEE